jgi:methylase of polypeptide subunit release factors
MLQHAMRLILGGALHVAKLPDKLERVLDCGTGTGAWAISFAE